MKSAKATLFTLLVLVFASVLSAQDIPPLTLPEDAPLALVESETLLTWDDGTFLEGIAIDEEGTMFITAFMPIQSGGAIWQVTPEGEASIFAEVTAGTVAFHPNGTLYSTVQFGSFTDPENFRVGLSYFDDEGVEESVLMFPEGSSPNGITFDENGNLYAADSSLGIIWIVTPDADEAVIWLEDERLTPQGPMGIPGANGIDVFDGAVYTVNSSTGDFFQVDITEDGSATEAEIVATGVTGDGFVIDDEGIAYITTHPFNTVVKVYPDGTKEIIGNADNEIVGPTDAKLFTDEAGQVSLYVVHDGGLFTQLIPPPMLTMFPETTQNDFLPPALVRLNLSPAMESD